jgi:hypothetical protein
LDLLFTCPSTSACFLLSKPLWVTQSRASRSKTTRDGKKKKRRSADRMMLLFFKDRAQHVFFLIERRRKDAYKVLG